jgi:signal transduction histidine kinase
MVSLAIGFILFVIYQLKIKTKEQILATRLQISRDLHDELGANISSINILTHLISNVLSVDSPTQKFMQQLKENSSSINETINDIIWNVNPRFDKLNDIVLRVKRYASPLLESACIGVTYDIQLTDENNVIEQHIKYNLYLLIKESINNCAKYSNASAVSIKIHSVGKWIYYEIKDDGIGFDLEAKKNNGNGLLNMQTRALAIHGKLTIETAPKKGTKIILVLK